MRKTKEKENAVERIRRLLNENFEDNEVKITVTYEDCSSKAETSLLTENM